MSENDTETPKKCYIIVGLDVHGKEVPCNKPVRYEGSFVCEDHVWNHYSGTKRRKLTIKEIQERILALRGTKHN